jgi:hypothetical protein
MARGVRSDGVGAQYDAMNLCVKLLCHFRTIVLDLFVLNRGPSISTQEHREAVFYRVFF